MSSAVSRPGRCVSLVRFEPLTQDEALQWLMRRGIGSAPDSALTISGLFAVHRGADPVPATPGIGFVPDFASDAKVGIIGPR